MILTYPVCRAVDDSGAILTAPIVTVVSVTDKAGTAIASHGATPNVAGSNVSVDYDAEAHGEAWINVSISQTGSAITGLNAAPSTYAARDDPRGARADPAPGALSWPDQPERPLSNDFDLPSL